MREYRATPHLVGVTKKVLAERQAELKARMLEAKKTKPRKRASGKTIPVQEYAESKE